MKRSPLERKAPLARKGELGRRKPMRQGRGLAASRAQREKVNGKSCISCGRSQDQDLEGYGPYRVDAAHLAARAHGGCDDALCVVPLCRFCHNSFDRGYLDLLPVLVVHRVPELQHALGHYNGDLIALLQRLTGQRWRPDDDRQFGAREAA